MLRIFSLIISIAVCIGILILVLGYNAPTKYSGSLNFTLDIEANILWDELMFIESIAEKKKDVKTVEILQRFGKLVAWKEHLNNGGYRIYRMNEAEAGQRLVLELIDSSYGLTGIWSIDLKKNDGETDVTISEESKLYNIRLRGTRVIFGRDHDLLIWAKYIRISATQSLIKRL